MVVVPNPTWVTRPVLLTVATSGFDEAQGVVGCGKPDPPDPVSCVVEGPGKQILKFPVMVSGASELLLSSMVLLGSVSIVPLVGNEKRLVTDNRNKIMKQLLKTDLRVVIFILFLRIFCVDLTWTEVIVI